MHPRSIRPKKGVEDSTINIDIPRYTLKKSKGKHKVLRILTTISTYLSPTPVIINNYTTFDFYQNHLHYYYTYLIILGYKLKTQTSVPTSNQIAYQLP